MKNIFLFIVTSIVTLIFLDIYMKVTNITPPILRYYDDTYGSLNRPNLNYFKCVEGLYFGKTNYDGRFREDYTRKKNKKTTLRILLIGDSFVEGIDVFSRNHFAQYMEDKLKKYLHTDVEVLNFGRGNCILRASSYYYINYIEKEYDADLVLYFTEFKDVFTVDYPSTSFELNDSGNLVAGYEWKASSEYRIDEKLLSLPVLKYYEDIAGCRLAYRAWAGIASHGFWPLTLGKFYGAVREESYKYNAAYEKIHVPVSALAKKIYDTLMTDNKSQIVFVVRNLIADATMIKDYFKEKNYPYIDLNDTLDKQMIRNTNVDAHYFKATKSYGGHWNHEGHKAVGNFLANRIIRDIQTYKMPFYDGRK